MVLKTLETRGKPEEIKINKRTRTCLRGLTKGDEDDRFRITKIRNNYFIAHLTNADLSIKKDFEFIKGELSIVNKSFVTLGKPIDFENGNVFIRDTMLLAPQGHKSLDSVGSLYGKQFKKVNIAKDLTENQKEELTKDLTIDRKENLDLNQYIKENMDLLLRVNKEKFVSYAVKDSIIPLIHANYMEDFNFKLKSVGIPLTLSSLGTTYVKN